MLMPASSEFVVLCRTQAELLVHGFGASLSAIYLTEDPTAERETALIPVVVLPEPDSVWPPSIPFVLPKAAHRSTLWAQLLHPQGATSSLQRLPAASASAAPAPVTPSVDQWALADGPEPTRMMLPLVYEDVIWGLLVVVREGRRWRKREQSQLEQIAQTLAIACVLDQRSQWLAQIHEQQRLMETQQQTRLSTLLHQFRNPLTTLRTLGKLMLRRLGSNDENRDLAQSIVGESDRLERLLRQFDEAIDWGDATLEPETVEKTPALLPGRGWLTGGTLTLQPCWLKEILEPLLHSIVGRVDEQNLHLEVAIPNDLPPIYADATALQEVFANLLDNAIKYTPAGGSIGLSVEQQPLDVSDTSTTGQYQVVQISDTGPGIPAQDLERIFERNYRGVQAKTNIPGTGLGLAIAKDLIEQMHGELQAVSPARWLFPEQSMLGSTFIVTLPELEPTTLKTSPLS